MIIIKLDSSTIVNADNIQGIRVEENLIEFDLPEGMVYKKEYTSASVAREAFDKLFEELASATGVDGAVLH